MVTHENETKVISFRKKDLAQLLFSQENLRLRVACEQVLLFGRVKRVSRERASERRSRERQGGLARLASLAQIGELARRVAYGSLQYKLIQSRCK